MSRHDTAASARAGATRLLGASLGLCVAFAFGPYVPGAAQLCVLAALLLLAFALLRGDDGEAAGEEGGAGGPRGTGRLADADAHAASVEWR